MHGMEWRLFHVGEMETLRTHGQINQHVQSGSGNENVLDWGMEKDYQRPQCHSGLLVPPIGACSHSVVVVPPN